MRAKRDTRLLTSKSSFLTSEPRCEIPLPDMVQALLPSQKHAQPAHLWKPGETPKGAVPWQKGQSGNPSGRGGKFLEAQSIAREASPKAARTMVELLDDPDPRVRGYAADKVREWAWGKLPDYDPKAEQPETQPIDPSQFSPQQREMIRQMLQLLLAAAEPRQASE